jgi:hypothetical protein
MAPTGCGILKTADYHHQRGGVKGARMGWALRESRKHQDRKARKASTVHLAPEPRLKILQQTKMLANFPD